MTRPITVALTPALIESVLALASPGDELDERTVMSQIGQALTHAVLAALVAQGEVTLVPGPSHLLTAEPRLQFILWMHQRSARRFSILQR
ncbi:hypothetical protein K7W42_22575 [Deinococcus sp. HMF7604]|uniref:hypothetical protein n=1 Tax=Deinococcus betulae TaxID=2873312 RepID=UPI001CCDB15E|nr:hypothetical protein [Deinococcus betulae]MBZ9753612.1 hypothetical protein [Deinococcus betulae]